jgi:hypothetical protein
MPHEVEHHYWHRQPCVQDAIAARYRDDLAAGRLVVDVGAGYDPFAPANEVVDMRRWKTFGARTVHLVDLESEPLPYTYKQVDFLYSRHTLEDLHNPLHLCREMNRVAKAGYIEVPSPASEFCRGVDGGKPHYRGYIHHRYFIWREDETLVFLPKYPYVEYVGMSDELEQRLAGLLGSTPVAWNTYFPWRGFFRFKLLRHDIDFAFGPEYPDLIIKAVNASIADAQRFAAEFGLGTATFVPSA